jgi:hypothetical protein
MTMSKAAWVGGFITITLPALSSAGDSFCTQTASKMLNSCNSEVYADFYKGQANCINLDESRERAECNSQVNEDRSEGFTSCKEQFASRKDACRLLGEERYDPEVEPDMFDANFRNPSNPNEFFPVKVGFRWEYQGSDEFNTVEVLDRAKLIDEIYCVVIRDRVFKDGKLVEDTDDWAALNKNGDVFYCGEEAKEYEFFPGDRPPKPELVTIDGSFKHDRDHDKGGLLFLGRPEKGLTYRQESSLGNAEDMAQVASVTFPAGAHDALKRFVPPALVRLLCHDDCVVIREWSVLEPGHFAYKYYARDVGFFLETKPDSGEVLQLVRCNVSPLCSQL